MPDVGLGIQQLRDMMRQLTLICLKPAPSNRFLADWTAWNANRGQTVTTTTARHDIRVGEALTKARKSSAAWSEGLVAMVRWRREKVHVWSDTAGDDVVERRSSVTRKVRLNSIRIGRGALSTRPSRRCGVSLSCHCQPWRRPCGPLRLVLMRPGEPRPHWTRPSQRVVKNIKTAHAQTWQGRRDRTCPRAHHGTILSSLRARRIHPLHHSSHFDRCAFASSAPCIRSLLPVSPCLRPLSLVAPQLLAAPSSIQAPTSDNNKVTADTTPPIARPPPI